MKFFITLFSFLYALVFFAPDASAKARLDDKASMGKSYPSAYHAAIGETPAGMRPRSYRPKPVYVRIEDQNMSVTFNPPTMVNNSRRGVCESKGFERAIRQIEYADAIQPMNPIGGMRSGIKAAKNIYNAFK